MVNLIVEGEAVVGRLGEGRDVFILNGKLVEGLLDQETRQAVRVEDKIIP